MDGYVFTSKLVLLRNWWSSMQAITSRNAQNMINFQAGRGHKLISILLQHKLILYSKSRPKNHSQIMCLRRPWIHDLSSEPNWASRRSYLSENCSTILKLQHSVRIAPHTCTSPGEIRPFCPGDSDHQHVIRKLFVEASPSPNQFWWIGHPKGPEYRLAQLHLGSASYWSLSWSRSVKL